MPWIVENLWLIPVLPMLAAALSAFAPQRCRRFSATLAIGSMVLSFLLSLCAFAHVLSDQGAAVSDHGAAVRDICNFTWFRFADGPAGVLKLGWVLDPLTAVMLVMVTFVGTLIFIYSLGYMAHDENFTRFFTFLSLFAGAMLGVVIANSLLLLFICWELVGLTSYLLIGFWYHKPSAAAAAKKAFITTRIGDVAFLIGIVWLYAQSGTLMFYQDDHLGCLEREGLMKLVPFLGIGASATGIALLIFGGAVGKSGQVPLHVWLPDAMEGPTPVSALIHAATMVAAGVFLVARVYPLMAINDLSFANSTGLMYLSNHTTALKVVTWIGAITAVFAASVAVAQNDIKRILAYSTVSQLGYMMIGLGTGGVAVGMFHLITHAFFKALLFMGAGSVIHGCHEEQDIRRMGGLKKYMPVTFATYAIGMLSLAGFPLLFSGFWSKDAILHAAHQWPSHGESVGAEAVRMVNQGPFYLGLFGALLTAFYMTRQVALVFFGAHRGGKGHPADSHAPAGSSNPTAHAGGHEPHESPPVMTWPLIILAFFAIALGFLGTPLWPWFQKFLGQPEHPEGVLPLMLLSSVVVFAGLGLGWWLYGRKGTETAAAHDPLEKLPGDIFKLLQNKFYVDEIYDRTIVAFNAWWSKACAFLDEWVWGGVVALISYVTLGLAWVNRAIDEYVINLSFDLGCRRVTFGGRILSRLQDGRVQHYLRIIGIALAALVIYLIWGGKGQ